MGFVDRSIRIIVAAILVQLYIFDIVTGTAGMTLLLPAGILLLTSLYGLCPLYSLLKISSCSESTDAI